MTLGLRLRKPYQKNYQLKNNQKSEHHHKETFITKYIFCQDHKMIAKQFLITGMLMAVVGMLMSAMFRVQLANPGETSFLYNLLPSHWLNEAGVLNPDK